MIVRTIFSLILALLIAKPVFAEPVDYFAKKESLYAQWEKVMGQYSLGPEREAAFKQYVTDPLGKMDTGRINDFKGACQDAKVAYDKKLFSAGSPPWSKTFKNGGDLDTQTSTIQEYYRLKKAAAKRGLKVVDNGNSFSIGSHEVTVHMPPSPYDNPTSRGGYQAALKSDVEAAERVAQTGTTSIPATGGSVQLRRNLMSTPVTEASDYYKKAHEGRDFLKGNRVSRQQVIESLNFSNKADYKMAQEMRKSGLNPGMAIHRKSLAELDAELGNRTGKSAQAYARKVNDRTFHRMHRMTTVAAKQSAKDFTALRAQVKAAEKAGDVRKAIALRQQLNNTRQQVQRVSEMSGRRELVRQIAHDADDVADAGGKGSTFLKKVSKNLKKVTPALKKLGGKVMKVVSFVSRVAQLHALKKEYDAAEQREIDWAKKIGRDPSTGGIAKEFLFGALGFHKAKERTDLAMGIQGKSEDDMLSWEYLKTFVAVEAYQVIDAASPFAKYNSTTRMVHYLEKNPEVAKQLLGTPIKTIPGTPLPLIPLPSMVAGSMNKEKSGNKEELPPDLPPMLAASLKKNVGKSVGKPNDAQELEDAPPPPMLSTKNTGKVKPRANPRPKPRKDIVYTGFNPAKPYTIKAIAVETEPRICQTTGNTSETFNGVIHGSEMTVIVRQEGNDHIISGNKAQYMLVRNGYIRNQKNCGYVTTKLYKTFGPGITQGNEPERTMNHNECMEKYCPGCAENAILGTAMGIYNSVDEEPDTYCADCLEEKRARINTCAGQ